MRLDHALREVPSPVAGEVEISSLGYDSRVAVPGMLFFCVDGFTHDGHVFAPEP